MFRRVDADLNTVMLGDAIQEGRAKVRAGQAQEDKIDRRTAALERELGVPSTRPGRDAKRRLLSLELRKQAEEMEAREGVNDL